MTTAQTPLAEGPRSAAERVTCRRPSQRSGEGHPARLSKVARFSPGLLFSRPWWWTTLLVIAGMGVMARLGIWQLDRLAGRRAANAEIVRQLSLPPLSLSPDFAAPENLRDLKNHAASARGQFDYERQIALKAQLWNDAPGVRLITPFVLEDGATAVLVDRGWIPDELSAPEHWGEFDESQPGTLDGRMQLSQTIAGSAAPTAPLAAWYRVDIAAIQPQMPYTLLPVYLQEGASAGSDTALPHRADPEFDLSEGPHLGYAIQWVLFALILGIGYVRYVSKSAPPKEGTA